MVGAGNQSKFGCLVRTSLFLTNQDAMFLNKSREINLVLCWTNSLPTYNAWLATGMHIIDLFSEYSVDLCRSYNLNLMEEI